MDHICKDPTSKIPFLRFLVSMHFAVAQTAYVTAMTLWFYSMFLPERVL